MSGSRLYPPHIFESEWEKRVPTKRFRLRPYAKKARQLVRKRGLEVLHRIRDDSELLGQLVIELVGPDPFPLKENEWRTPTSWDRRARQAQHRLLELAEMHVIDLMNQLVEV